jgi:hypothetical protein
MASPIEGDMVSWEGTRIKKRFFGVVDEVLGDSYRIRTTNGHALLTIKAHRVKKETKE